ncbi:2-hydroxyacyl-CoA dehydratase [Caldanaerobius polysaccharolyticus]|uniref:2-hydroxyacyl-CoA dehydratase n=1 Tax=Caldanaerobius polysaccharolyticus TaxID=44256 RepID=UPI00047AA78B|nr:2-hydroxyacyl-CoA dehydratase [Caldanaerobius polysaccharolyticus]
MKITFPHMGSLSIALKCLFEHLGAEVIVPPPITKKTLDIGVQHSPELACLPLKINVGNYIEAIEKGAEAIVMLGGVGPCRFGYYGQVQKEILRDLGYDVKMVVVDPPDRDLKGFLQDLAPLFPKATVKNVLHGLNLAWRKIVSSDRLERQLLISRAHERKRGEATRIFEKYIDKLDEADSVKEIKKVTRDGIEALRSLEEKDDRDPLKIVVIGEIYFLLEPYPSQNIYKELNELGAEVIKTEYLSDYLMSSVFVWKFERIKKYARPYLKRHIGGHGVNSIGNAVKYAGQCDGIIHIFPFTCTPEIVAQGILQRVSKDMNVPIMSLSYDENTGTAGYQTRLEAFIDLLHKKRDSKEAVSSEGLSWS